MTESRPSFPPRMLHGDARALPLEDDTVDCIVTSPPYNVGAAYDGVDDLIPWEDYRRLATQSALEMRRVLKSRGRVWLNVAAQTNHPDETFAAVGHRQDLSRIWQEALLEARLAWRDTVIWHKPTGNNSTAWGSKLSPNAPNLRGRYEPILLHFKDIWTRSRVEPNDIEMADWLEYTRNVWTFGTTGPTTNGGHPCPFPAELPRRAILLSTWPGDTVLDPFAGSGTTLRVAHALGRQALGIEASQAYVDRWHETGVQEVLA